jgi:hypothetical protein
MEHRKYRGIFTYHGEIFLFFNVPFLALSQKVKKSYYRSGQALRVPGV